MIALLLEPFQFAFMNNALLISLLVAVPCALLSVFLVLKGWALMGDAMSHAVFPGVVLAWMMGLPLALGAFVAGLFCAVATGYLKDNSRIKQDTVMGIVFSGMFGAGLILYIAVKPEVHLDHILFGDMLGISLRDIGQTTAIALVIALIIGLKWRDFLLHAFDPTQAKASGLRGGLLHYGLLCMIALTIVATLQSVGIILSISLLIAPGAIALLLVRRFIHALLLAVAAVAVAMGHYCRSRYDRVAILKTLGAGRAQLRKLIVGQWLMLLVLSVFTGGIIGLLFEKLLMVMLKPVLPSALPPASFWPWLWAIGAMVVISVLVGLRPYRLLLATQPLRVLRNDVVANVWPLKFYLPVIIAVAVGLLAWLMGGSTLLWAVLAGAVVLALLCGVLGWILLNVLKRLTVNRCPCAWPLIVCCISPGLRSASCRRFHCRLCCWPCCWCCGAICWIAGSSSFPRKVRIIF